MNESFWSMRITRRQMLVSLPALAMVPRSFLQTPNPPIRATGINHVTLSVSDVKRSVDFYQGLFGMPVISRGTGGAVNLRIGNGPQFLGLSPADGNAPNINRVCFGVEDFNVDRLKNILMQRSITDVRVQTPEFLFRDPDGLLIQLQDPRYCGGCSAPPEPSPKKGLLQVRDWSHTTNAVSDRARSNKFYQEVFGLHIQAYQGPGAAVMGIGRGVQFLMFTDGGNQPRPASINHACMSMDNFNPDFVIKALESYGIKPRGNAQGAHGPMVHYINMRMENRGGAKEGTPELYFTDPDGLLMQLQDTKYCGGAGGLGDVCNVK
jgi:catechol 2,3-dioxygenase-like lactoylglutathione lyase family enzyme